jgi:ankyrin repeat protein
MPSWPWRKPRPGVDAYGRSPLWYAAMDGDLKALERLLKAGADPTASDKDGYGALHVAAQGRHLAVVDRLLAAGADPNAADKHGNGPLWTAGYYAGPGVDGEAAFEVVARLLAAGADPAHLNRVGKAPTAWAEGNPRLAAVYERAGVATG